MGPTGARGWLAALAWLVILALVPWWLGLPPLLAIAAALLLATERLGEHAPLLRRALRWGLPGMLWALQRALGGDALAWAVALVGALVGYTLLAGLESWLDRGEHAQPTPSSGAVSPEWPELAMSEIGPRAAIIELQPVQWLAANSAGAAAEPVQWQAAGPHRGDYRLADGARVDGASPQYCFSPARRWFATPLPRGRGTVLLDRHLQRTYRLRGWALCGWQQEQPWLQRGAQEVPHALKDVLGDRAESVSTPADAGEQGG